MKRRKKLKPSEPQPHPEALAIWNEMMGLEKEQEHVPKDDAEKVAPTPNVSQDTMGGDSDEK